VYYCIKNNLQGVAGLMQQVAARRPEVQPIIAEVVGQVQAIAQVYGLQVGGVGPLKLASVAEAIVQSVQRTFGRSIRWAAWSPSGQPEPAPLWTLPEAEAIPIALTLNELLTNAIKHSPALAEVGCELHSLADGARIDHQPGPPARGIPHRQPPGHSLRAGIGAGTAAAAACRPGNRSTG